MFKLKSCMSTQSESRRKQEAGAEDFGFTARLAKDPLSVMAIATVGRHVEQEPEQQLKLGGALSC